MINSDFHFLRPEWLLALLPLAVLALWLLRQHKRQGNWLNVCDAELLPYLLQTRAGGRAKARVFWPLSLAFVLAVIALAGPTWQRLPAPAFRNDTGLVIALNLSVSMDADDIKPSRLLRSRYKITDLLRQRKDGQSALLVYTRQAFVVTPLTDDVETILNLVSGVNTDIMPIQGRNTLAAIRQSVDLLKQAGIQQGDILLVTDAVEAIDPAALEKTRGPYRISVLAVGTETGAPIKQTGGGFLKDKNGNIIVARLQVKPMKKLASLSGGIFQSMTADDRDIQTLTHFFDRAAKAQGAKDAQLKLNVWRDFGPYLLWLVVPLAALGFRKGLLCLALLVLLPLPQSSWATEHSEVWQKLWKTDDQRGQQAFKQQQFERAAELFKQPDWRAAALYKAGKYEQAAKIWQQQNSAEADYNRGNALAQAGKLKAAIEAYQQALAKKPGFEAAKKNKELIEKLLKQQQQKQQQSSDSKKSESQKNQQNQNQQDSSDTSQNAEQNSVQDQSKSDNGEQLKDQRGDSSKQTESSPKDKKESVRDEEKQAKAKQPADESKADAEQKAVTTSEAKKPNEDQQAVEQWLNRIPDEPSGLLRRKFRYQYQQRRQ
ncbi:VWA domain-containing protein [methane-oxidizing endosymbiont of Gigantopelta aegis]|uniref:VWA domain-containing protein n=1 Tax=methane-oxidizing endosymbiont of Gigantopelta aegis TaxID=2794938 RepID=UPI0018DEC8EC|nr:VWA domain-containing protein [methane-oxidizing endosymbiont of Gigantopelta aegis]